MLIRITEITGCVIQDVMYVMPVLESLFFNYLTEHNMIFWNKQQNPPFNYPGATVVEPKVGYHKNVVCLDVNSLYPHIFINWYISPETYTPVRLTNCVETPICTYFKKDKDAIVPKVIKILLDERKKLRSMGDNIGQQVYKILANAIYGSFGNPKFRLTNKAIAETITACGRDFLAKLREYINMYFDDGEDHIVYGDTDSVFIKTDNTDIEKVVNDYLIPIYYEERGLEITEDRFRVKDEYGVAEMIVLPIKKTYILKKPNGDIVFKNIDKSNRINIAMEVFKYIAYAIFEGEITSYKQVEELGQELIASFKLNKDYLASYRVRRPREEYSSKQQWMEGLDNFYKIYPDFNGDDKSGVIINCLGEKRYSNKTGKELKGREKHILCVPDGIDIEEAFDKTGWDIDIDHYAKLLTSMLPHYKEVLGEK